METGNAIANGTGHAPPRTVFRDLDALEKITVRFYVNWLYAFY